MSNSYLKLEGSVPLAGPIVEKGEHLLFRTRTDMTKSEFAEFYAGEIEIDGVIQRVALESAGRSQDGAYSMDLMLRRLPV